MTESSLRKPSLRLMKGPSALSNESRAQSEPINRPFEELFLEHWSRVYRLLVRLVGDPAEAEDLALETFYRLYRQPPQQGEGWNLRGWLNRVATNLGLHSIRSFRRKERYELTAGKNALDEACEDRPAELISSEEEKRHARLVLSQMDPRQAQLLVMRYSGMAYKDIAMALSLSPTSIGPLLVRAEREFEKRFRAIYPEE
jgi:RNA polymerase sigma-70 factor (ECF subfamily)